VFKFEFDGLVYTEGYRVMMTNSRPSMSSQCPVMTQTHTIQNDKMTARTSAGV